MRATKKLRAIQRSCGMHRVPDTLKSFSCGAEHKPKVLGFLEAMDPSPESACIEPPGSSAVTTGHGTVSGFLPLGDIQTSCEGS